MRIKKENAFIAMLSVLVILMMVHRSYRFYIERIPVAEVGSCMVVTYDGKKENIIIVDNHDGISIIHREDGSLAVVTYEDLRNANATLGACR